MVSSQMSSLTLPALLFNQFTKFDTTEEEGEEEQEQAYSTLADDFTNDEIQQIIYDPSLRSINCSSDEQAIGLLILRSLAMKDKRKFPSVIVVRTKHHAQKVLKIIDEHLVNAKIANNFSQIKRTKNYTQKGNPDFILCSYHNLFKLVASDNWETVSGIVFLSPLSRRKYRSESILLDQILNLIPKNTIYTFIHGKELHMRKEELEWLFAGPAIIFRDSDLSRYDLLKDFQLKIFEDKNLVRAARKGADYQSTAGASYLLKLILTLVFHRRMNITAFFEGIENSISYKLWYSFEQGLIKSEDDIVTYSPSFQLGLILLYLTGRCRIKLLEKRNKKDGYYYLTTEGRKFFERFCFSDGLATSLFYVLHALSKKLEKGYISAKDLEVLLNDFTNLDIIWDVFYIDSDSSANSEVQKVLAKSYTFRSAHDIFEGLDEDFGLLAEDAKRNLTAQKAALKTQKEFQGSSSIKDEKEQVVEEESTTVSFDDPKITKIYSKEFLEEHIQKAVTKKNIIPSQFALDTGISTKLVKKTLERLTRKGFCSKITTNGVHCKEALYGIEENFKAEPHIKKTCDNNCVAYNHKTSQCITNRLKAEVAFSTLTIEQQKRAFNCLRKGTRACNDYQDAEEGIDFSVEYSEFGMYTREVNQVLIQNQKDSQDHFKHICRTCHQPIKAFGSEEEPIFPSPKITCTNCNSKYIYDAERGTVRYLSDNQNIIRSMLITELTYEPSILKQKKDRIPLNVSDDDTFELHKNEELGDQPEEEKFDSYILHFKDKLYALSEIERIYFSGSKHKELEVELKELGFTWIYRKKVKNENPQEDTNVDSNSLDEETKNYYQGIITLLRTKGVMVNSFLIRKIFSVITFILAFKDSLSQKNLGKKGKYNKELGECAKILMRAKNNVTDPDAARLLEGQAFKQAFRILKKVGRKAGIRSWGRVVSRLVTWMVFATFTRTCAYSQLDAMLNHLFKVVLNDLKAVHRKAGIDVDFGPGLLHFRKSKSDIDNIGLFLDLVDFIRLLVIFVLVEAISNGEITSKDCRLFLGRGAIPLYDIKLSSFKKFDSLVEQVLTYKIYYKNQELALIEAYEDYLKSFRLFLNYLSKHDIEALELLSQNELRTVVDNCLEKANCQPIYFSIKDLEQKVKDIDLCSDEWKFLYEGFQDKFLARKEVREAFRRDVKSDIFGNEELVVDLSYNSFQEKYRASLTKYQKRERRWMFFVLLIFILRNKERGDFVGYTIRDFSSFLGLKYDRIRILLNKMVDQNLIILTIGINRTHIFFLNTRNESIELLTNTINRIPENNDLIIVNQADNPSSKFLILKMKQYLLDFLEKSAILRIDQSTSYFESKAKGILSKINNWMVI